MKLNGTSASVKIIGCLSVILGFSSASFAQLVEVPIAPHPPSSSKYYFSARTQNVTPLNLPFWDDFSYTDTFTFPQERLWQFGKSVFLNNSLGVKPPTKNFVTFDGVDSIGKPYNVNDILAKGLADKLVSQPIRMDLVDAALRSSVYLSFYYQAKGNGESPDTGDQLILSFKNAENKWEVIHTIENSSAIAPDIFYQVILPVSEDRFYHNTFQFRFQNFSRLSGPYDNWHVDYVYLNTGRSSSDNSYPDRAVSTPMTSLFVDYFSMPIKHFLQNPAGNLKKPSLDLYNLKSGNFQPFDYSTEATITTRINTIVTSAKIPLDVAQDPGSLLTGLQFLNLTLNKIPSVSDFNPLSDSIGIRLKYGMATKDNVAMPGGDYDPAKYSPMDFRFSDSIQANYVLSSYYAYDDASAEYGAGLNQAGSFLAIQFTMKTAQPDTLVYVDIYFPEFGDNTSQSLLFQVRNNLTDVTSAPLYQQLIVVDRKTQNKFVRYVLTEYVVLKGLFYIGWKQLTNVTIPVGLDKNTDNGNKLYYSTNGTWIQNTSVKGSLMVRPVFGKGKSNGVVTGLLTESVRRPIYPNPTSRICYLPGEAENVIAFDITGRRIEIELQPIGEQMSLSFLSPIDGLVIFHYQLKGKFFAEKVMVKVE